jgi:hypothetical protein
MRLGQAFFNPLCMPVIISDGIWVVRNPKHRANAAAVLAIDKAE